MRPLQYLFRWVFQLDTRLDELENAMSEQQTDQQHLDSKVDEIAASFKAAIDELKAQHQAGQPLDFSKLDSLTSSVDSEAAADAPVVPPAPAA